MSGTVHNIAVVLTGNNTSLKGSLLAAGNDVEKFTKTTEGAGKSATQAGQLMKLGIAAGATAVAAGLAFAISQAAQFDTQMRNVQSITKESDASIHQMGATLIDMSTKLPQSATTLAAGLYDIASSGFAGADGLKILNASATAASAGLTTTEISARAITAVINSYGLEAKDAADISDVLFQTVNLGVITFEELAGSIGHVVGTAAAATVSIGEVGAAIATMTLSGISGAESSVSLNRVLQSLIKPSDDMAKALNKVGYESGASALKIDPLNVVIGKLRTLSQGNIETLLKWFPEIRALRGALALMGNDGKTYAKSVAEIQDKQARAGATTAALNEQMKAASFQWQLFKNRVDAAAITVGVALLPVVINTMKTMTTLGTSTMPLVMSAAQRLTPLWQALAAVGGNIVTITKEMVDILGPAAKGFAGLIGLPVIVALNTFGAALEAASGFLANNKVLVEALTLLLIGRFVSGLQLGGKMVGLMGRAMEVAIASGDGLKFSLSGLASAATSPTAAFAILALGLAAIVMAQQNAEKQAKELRAELEKKIDFTDPDSIRAGVDRIKDSLKDEMVEWHKHDGIGGILKGTLEVLTPMKNSVLDNAAAVKELTQAEQDNLGKAAMLEEKYATVAHTLGITSEAVQAFVDKNPDIDPMTMSYGELADAIGNVQVVAAKATPQQAEMSEAFQKVADATADAKTQVDAFKSALDILFGVEIDIFNGTTQAAKSMNDFAGQMIETRKSGLGVAGMFDANTVAGEKNRDSLSQVTSNWIQLAQAMSKKGDIEGAVGKLEELDGKLRGILTSAGLTKPQIDALLASLGLVQGNYDAILSLKGQGEAQASLDTLIAGLKGASEGATVPITIKNMSGSTQNQIDYWIGQLAVTDPTVTVYVDGKPAEISFDYLQKLAKAYADGTPEATALLNKLDPDHKFASLQELAKHWNETRPSAVANVWTGQADAAFASLNNNAHAWGSLSVDSKLGVQDNATPVINKVQSEVDALHDKNITLTVNEKHIAVQAAKDAEHSRWGNVMAFAGGGVTPAHVQRGQALMYAEPATGGEAFVPRLGDPARSTSILKTAAAWYGLEVVKPMATGGINNYRDQMVMLASVRAAGGGGFTMTLTVAPGAVRVDVRADASIDPGALADRIKEAVEPAFDTLIDGITSELRMR